MLTSSEFNVSPRLQIWAESEIAIYKMFQEGPNVYEYIRVSNELIDA